MRRTRKRGQSASAETAQRGKTTLVEMIRESHLDSDSGVTVSCERPCRVIEGDLWKEQISYISESIVFIDEGSSFVESEEFVGLVKGSSNYFVIVTRENLEMLPISVEEVYGIKSSGKYGSLQPVYHEMYRLYDIDIEAAIMVKPSLILVEDSNSGYELQKLNVQRMTVSRWEHGDNLPTDENLLLLTQLFR